MKLNALIIFSLILIGFHSVGQRETFLSRSSFGPMVGGSYYIGDLNKYRHFQNTHLSGGLIYRYYINSRIELRGALKYGKVSGADELSKNPTQQLRNLSFESSIFEIAGGLEFNYFNYKLGDGKYFFSPYLFVEIGVFRMKPMTEYNGDLIELQPLGTEGQGTSLSDEDYYSLTQLVIPFGIGFKLNLGKKAAISFEYGLRKTFTDYLDDVSGNYVDGNLLAEESGNLAARLSNRSIGDYEAIGPRGNSSTKDWYSMFGIMLTFPLGKEGKCYYH